MNSFIGKSGIRIVLLAGIFCTCFMADADEILYSDDFESTVPGRLPRKWGKAWGNLKDDLYYISSEKSVSGRNSLMFEHFESPGQWGARFQLPSPKKGVQTVTLSFYLDGPANQTYPSFELRDRKNPGIRLANLGFKRQKMNTWAKQKKKTLPDSGTLGLVENGRWYRLNMRFPLTPADGEFIHYELTDLSSGSKTETKIGFPHPTDGIGSLFLNFPPNTKNWRIFLDDFSVSVANP